MKASTKKMVAVLAGLQSHLPQEELNDFDDSVAQRIMDDLHTGGREFMRFLQNCARVQVAQVVGEHVVDCDKDPQAIGGLRLESHRKNGMVKLEKRGNDLYTNGHKIDLYLSDNQKRDGYVVGTKLRKKLDDKPTLNANVLDYFLEHQELIPESWKGKCVFFWADIYRGSLDDLYVRCLCWRGGRWRSYCLWLDLSFYSSSPAVVASQELAS